MPFATIFEKLFLLSVFFFRRPRWPGSGDQNAGVPRQSIGALLTLQD